MSTMDDITKCMDNWDGQNLSNDDLFADAPPLKRCDGCGKYVEENLLKKCRVCGKYFCPVCRKTHDCRIADKQTESEHNSTGHIHESVPPAREWEPIKEEPSIETKTETKASTSSPVRDKPSRNESDKKKEIVVRLYGTIFVPSIIMLILSLICFFIFTSSRMPILTFIPITLLIIGVCLLIAEIVRYNTEYYIITPESICRRFGVINKEREDIRLDKIDGTHIKRGLFDLIFGSGKIIFYSVGGRHKKFGPIGHPYKIQGIIAERQRVSEK